MTRLGLRTLNRTTLHRQSLLERSTRPTTEIIEHLVGMQAQNPNDPYWALWSRVVDFDVADLADMISKREAVRGQLMRATIHLVTTRDFLTLRPQMDPVCARTLGSTVFSKDTKHVDRSNLLAEGRSLLDPRPMTRAELGPLLAEVWPDAPAASLAQVVTYLLPVVQVPPRGIWKQTGPAAWATIEKWAGASPDMRSDPQRTVHRYLAAFGPASIADMRVWSGLPGLREVVAGMRGQLTTYEDEDGRELLDLPDMHIVDEDTPAPPRFLPEYDNLLLGHADRSRFFLPGVIPQGWSGNLLVDGLFTGAWKTSRAQAGSSLTIDLMRAITKLETTQLMEEAERLLVFTFPDAEHSEITLRHLT